MAITDKDIKKLSGIFATKKDLEKFATKKDIERFATKEDLSSVKGEIFSIKEELKKFATKEDLKQFRNEVVNGLDKVMGELEKVREDRVFAKAKDDEQDKKFSGLEQRFEEHIKLPSHSAI